VPPHSADAALSKTLQIFFNRGTLDLPPLALISPMGVGRSTSFPRILVLPLRYTSLLDIE